MPLNLHAWFRAAERALVAGHLPHHVARALGDALSDPPRLHPAATVPYQSPLPLPVRAGRGGPPPPPPPADLSAFRLDLRAAAAAWGPALRLPLPAAGPSPLPAAAGVKLYTMRVRAAM